MNRYEAEPHPRRKGAWRVAVIDSEGLRFPIPAWRFNSQKAAERRACELQVGEYPQPPPRRRKRKRPMGFLFIAEPRAYSGWRVVCCSGSTRVEMETPRFRSEAKAKAWAAS